MIKKGSKMEEIRNSYLTKKQLVEKYSFLTENMLKNMLFKNLEGFREKTVKKFGERILIDELAFLEYLRDLKAE
jgi:hypothetical protein